MAFKSMKTVNSELFGNMLRLNDDGKSVRGVFLYKSDEDVLLASAHYIKTDSYSGYVHCCEAGCPACANGIRKQNKLFIPFLVLADLNPDLDLDEDKLLFWDRNTSFNHQLQTDVFDRYPDPSKYVFKITRHGAWKDRNTRYEISVVMNFNADIDDVLPGLGVKLPDAYERVIRDMSPSEMSDVLGPKQSSPSSAYQPESSFSYKAMPRKRFTDPEDISESLPGEEVVPSKPVPFETSGDPVKVGTFEVRPEKNESGLEDYVPSTKNNDLASDSEVESFLSQVRQENLEDDCSDEDNDPEF